MKKIIILTLPMFFYISTLGQITIEHTYSYSPWLQLFNLSNNGYKWCLLDTINPNSVKIYNMNHTIWKTITLNPPTDCKVLAFYNVSESLFNNDDLVEVCYTFRNTISYNESGVKVTNESGTDLFSSPLHYYAYVVFVSAGQDGAKMIIGYQNSSSDQFYSYDIYSLPGQLMTKINTTTVENIELSAFPNPTKEHININYDIPGGNNKGELIIYNCTGSEVIHYDVDRNFKNILINTNDFPTGQYFYKIKAGNEESKTKKFIIQ